MQLDVPSALWAAHKLPIVHMPEIEYYYAYMQNFMFVGVLVMEILEFNWKEMMKKSMAKL